MTYIPSNLCIILLKFSRKYIQSLQIEVHRGKQLLCILWKKESESRSVMSDSLQPCELYSPWNSPGQNTGVDSLSLSRRSPQPRDRIQISHIAGGFFTSWATREAFSRLSKFYRYRANLNLALMHCILIHWYLFMYIRYINLVPDLHIHKRSYNND